MYCSKCRRQSPDNFSSCAYCGAPFKSQKRQTERRFKVKKEYLPFLTSAKKSVIVVALAAIIVIVSVLTGIITGIKPDSVIKTAIKATEKHDSNMYYSIFDEHYTEYCKQNKYYDDEETKKALTDALEKSYVFYKNECGDDFSLSYKIKNITYYSDMGLEELNSELALTYAYKKSASSAARFDVEITAKGEKGEYTTVYRDYCCIKLGGKWYKCEVVQQ